MTKGIRWVFTIYQQTIGIQQSHQYCNNNIAVDANVTEYPHKTSSALSDQICISTGGITSGFTDAARIRWGITFVTHFKEFS